MTGDRPGYPYAHTAVARYLDRRIDELRGVRTQREIAADAGFNKANVVSMLRSGQTQLPFDKIPGMARALNADPAHIFRLALEDRWPELRSAIGEIFGKKLATQHEYEIFLSKWRVATHDADPKPNSQIAAAVDLMLTSLASVLP